MPPYPKIQPAEAERAELEGVVQALARWPRLSQLLRYMGDKLFSGELDQITEYNIATEVLGRSKTLFNAAEDAIARVETHRLRKRLAAFYETDGKDHLVQITLPAGSYIPVFVHRREEKLLPMSAKLVPASAGFSTASASDSHGDFVRPLLLFLTRHWIYSIAGVCLAIAALAAYLYHIRPGERRPVSSSGGSAPPVAASSPRPAAASSGPLRILAGYSGPPRTDSAGNVWNPDRFFTGGGTWQGSSAGIARTSDLFVFEHSRPGDFSYSIPLKPGSYDLHLFFSAASQSVSTFNVFIGDQYLLAGFDINSDAMGENIADERVFRDVSPEPDGFLHISFAGALGPPTLNAIEILIAALAAWPNRATHLACSTRGELRRAQRFGCAHENPVDEQAPIPANNRQTDDCVPPHTVDIHFNQLRAAAQSVPLPVLLSVAAAHIHGGHATDLLRIARG